jgi:hypothetical protein
VSWGVDGDGVELGVTDEQVALVEGFVKAIGHFPNACLRRYNTENVGCPLLFASSDGKRCAA